MRHLAVPDTCGTLTLDVSALPPGIYSLHLRDAKRWLAGSTVIVQ
jgi:hypothetical protein